MRCGSRYAARYQKDAGKPFGRRSFLGLSGQELSPEFRQEVFVRLDFLKAEMTAAYEWLRSGK
ncbi:hypothetical protein BcepF1.028 [Burkholderia phage BcepF1]|uniref:Uncharacterized protein n=1 Tax=Burkholderia phage BcepF1 TaxID=2886897 RepID=A1YZT2_9CAUD|nr:hypothetical protein BcepF1.028 [Burkholderia phage BcepF1]ABL96759.1 hypothetical protein BcepF1.028 [Burkholderia phage BcepF1]